MTQETSLEQRITQMLTEARVVLPGVQALLGFQLISVVTRSFEQLPASSKLVHAASLGCLTVAIVFLMAPAANHRIVFAGQTPRRCRWSRFIALPPYPSPWGSPGIFTWH